MTGGEAGAGAPDTADASETHGLARQSAMAFAGFRRGEMDRMDELVELLTPLLWHTARAQGLEHEIARDVVQTTWLRLVEHADRIKDPQAVLGWLVMTTRRESWRLVQRDRRTATDELNPEDPHPEAAPGPDERVVLRSRQATLWRHLSELSQRCRTLLRVIAFGDRPDYAAIAAGLQMPVGSIGPTRGRCLAKLRAALLADPRWEGRS